MSASIIALMLRPRAARRPVSIRRGSSTAWRRGGELRGERVERAAHFVDVRDPARVERRDEDAAAGRIEHEAVLLQQAQRLQHRLARDREALGEVFLRDARARLRASRR